MLNDSYTLGDCDDIWYTCLSGQDNVSRAHMFALPCWPFELYPLDEFYRGNIVRSKSIVPLEIL